MNDKDLKTLLANLHETLGDTDEVDAETLRLVRELDEEIHRLSERGGEVEGVLDKAKSVETRFAVDHPVAEGFLREIIDTLAKLGI
jgi:Domain of unknown function (DUF4404)